MKTCPLCRELFPLPSVFFTYGEIEICPTCHQVIDATEAELEEAGVPKTLLKIEVQ